MKIIDRFKHSSSDGCRCKSRIEINISLTLHNRLCLSFPLIKQLEIRGFDQIKEFNAELTARLDELGYTALIHIDRWVNHLDAARFWASLRPVGLIAPASREALRSLRVRRGGTILDRL